MVTKIVHSRGWWVLVVGLAALVASLSAPCATVFGSPPNAGKVAPSGKQGFAGTKPGQEWSDNGLKTKFCWCPAGKFTMGSPKGLYEDQAEVTLSRGFWLGKYELTQGEWRQIMETTLRQQFDKIQFNNTRKPNYGSFDEGARYPMSCVNHDEATEFCRKLTEQERKAGRLPADWEYRLPTEAQWEYACRAGTTTKAAFELTRESANFDWDFHPNENRTAEPPRAKTVGGYRANAWGLHDMYGNVQEWCRDWYAAKNGIAIPRPGGTDPEVTEPGARRGMRVGRVARGGSFGTADWASSATRESSMNLTRALHRGFRVALVQSGK
jgi:sulfatase modifying factor 1